MKKFLLLALISTSAFAVDVDTKEKETSKEEFKNTTYENKQTEVKVEKEKNEPLSKNKFEAKKLNINDNELLKLLVQTFLGNQDLENAYEVS
ncbi:MAG: hypothetical protein ACPLXN_04755, partial [Sulfurihydrogenibium sp.]|uniref:hypothetical protein n=1 Tax=Sulfurihydrogenibium sp. TaxID=2053621 RepID=UPI003C7A756D